jgi:hypothetical protein
MEPGIHLPVQLYSNDEILEIIRGLARDGFGYDEIDIEVDGEAGGGGVKTSHNNGSVPPARLEPVLLPSSQGRRRIS